MNDIQAFKPLQDRTSYPGSSPRSVEARPIEWVAQDQEGVDLQGMVISLSNPIRWP